MPADPVAERDAFFGWLHNRLRYVFRRDCIYSTRDNVFIAWPRTPDDRPFYLDALIQSQHDLWRFESITAHKDGCVTVVYRRLLVDGLEPGQIPDIELRLYRSPDPALDVHAPSLWERLILEDEPG